MANGLIKATIVPQSALGADQYQVELSLSDQNDAPLSVGAQMPLQADTTAVDLAALKVDFNALLTKLKNAGLMASS